MRKIRIEYDSPLEAMIAATKRLSIFEVKYRMESEEFFDKYANGMMEDSKDFVEWANDYQHYAALRFQIEARQHSRSTFYQNSAIRFSTYR